MSNGDFDTLDNLPTIQGGDGEESKLLADRYKIIRKLGEGGMGMVYLAEDAELSDSKVAIKFIPPQLAGNAKAVKNLKKEAQTAMQLSHPNIVRLHDLHTDGHQKFLVMEYIEGKTLDDLLAAKDEGKLTLDELLPIAEQIALGLDFAHSKKVLHRDLKPSNIMIDKNGTVKLLDFGIAREMKDSMTRVTGQETSGTLPYMSPEQLRGQPPSASMDIYAFACVIYECLCGQNPFYTGDLRYQILNEQSSPIPTMPEYVNNVIARALSKRPKERPQHAEQFILELAGKHIEETSVSKREQQKISVATKSLKTEKRPSLELAKFPEWSSWRKENDICWYSVYLLVYGVTGIIALILIPLGLSDGHSGAVIIGLALIAVSVSIHLIRLMFLKNRYRLICAKICLKNGDPTEGLRFILSTHKLGIDGLDAGRITLKLAQLASQYGNEGGAEILFRYAKEYWNIPYVEGTDIRDGQGKDTQVETKNRHYYSTKRKAFITILSLCPLFFPFYLIYCYLVWILWLIAGGWISIIRHKKALIPTGKKHKSIESVPQLFFWPLWFPFMMIINNGSLLWKPFQWAFLYYFSEQKMASDIVEGESIFCKPILICFDTELKEPDFLPK